MDRVLAVIAGALVAGLQVLPLRWVAWLGRRAGALAYFLDARHRRVAIENLTAALGRERSPAELRGIARENFRRLGENYASSVRTAAMSDDEIRRILDFTGAEHFDRHAPGPASAVVAIGHFGNFELYARASLFVPGSQFATTYRALPQPALNRLLQRLRERSGCLYFERRTEAAALREAMNQRRLMLGFLADQHAGDRGLPLPFFGRLCSTSAAPAVFALRYGCPLHVAICYRTAFARWRIELGPAIPTHAGGAPRSAESIAADMNRAYEEAVRRDPANWFWVHRRWKPVQRKPRQDGATEPQVSAPVGEGRRGG